MTPIPFRAVHPALFAGFPVPPLPEMWTAWEYVTPDQGVIQIIHRRATGDAGLVMVETSETDWVDAATPAGALSASNVGCRGRRLAPTPA